VHRELDRAGFAFSIAVADTIGAAWAAAHYGEPGRHACGDERKLLAPLPLLGFALASKWVAAYAIGGLGILVLTRSALGRLLLITGLVLLTTVLGYIAISVPVNNYLFLIIMTGLVLASVVAVVQHPIAWTWEEERFAIGVPIVIGAAIVLYGMVRGAPEKALKIGPVAASPIELAFVALDDVFDLDDAPWCLAEWAARHKAAFSWNELAGSAKLEGM